MRGNWQLLIPIIAAAVWILTSLIRSAEDQRVRRARAQPEPEEPERPRRSATEVDRFLQEVQRRRRDAEERRPAPVADDIPLAVLVEPSTTTPLPRTTSRTAAERTARRRSVETTAFPVAQVVTVVPAAPVWQAPPPAPPQPPPVGGVKPPAAAGPSIVKQLRSLLRSPQTVGTAVVLREIFDRPLSQRRRG